MEGCTVADLPGPMRQLPWEKLLDMESAPPTASQVVGRPKNGRLRARHRIAVTLSENGWRNKDIAKALGYTESRISIILRSGNEKLKVFRNEIAQRVADNMTDVSSRITLYANEMLTRLVDHARQDERPELSRLASRDILHMAGFTPIKKQFNLNATVPVDQLDKVLPEIHKANEAALHAAAYVIKDVEVMEKSA